MRRKLEQLAAAGQLSELSFVPVPEAERTCPQCGADKKCIGHRTSEVLEFVPAQFRIIEEQREKLACPSCPEQGVTTADSEKVMDRGRPGPGLLANSIVEKFEDAMPLYRQAQQYARVGVSLSPSTLGEWSAFALDVLAPVAKRIQERVLGSCYLRADDTGIRVLDQDHPAGVKRGHIWAFVGAELVAFVYAPDWRAKHPAALLQGFTGYLQGDRGLAVATPTHVTNAPVAGISLPLREPGRAARREPLERRRVRRAAELLLRRDDQPECRRKGWPGLAGSPGRRLQRGDGCHPSFVGGTSTGRWVPPIFCWRHVHRGDGCHPSFVGGTSTGRWVPPISRLDAPAHPDGLMA
ncbi:IS66 family transposase [Sorangium sp. So ce1128]